MRADAWAALAAWVTVGIALGALVFAWRQVTEAKTLREEQAAPYVVAYMELVTRDFTTVDFVVKNFGATAAHNINIMFVPLPQKTFDGGVIDFRYPTDIPYLAPGQEWRGAWDYAPARRKMDLPEPYKVKIVFEDRSGKKDTSSADLDWAFIWNQVDQQKTSLRDVVRGLDQLGTALGRMAPPPAVGPHVKGM
ncbi:hypothetical protein GS898_17335 [Rhodococcus hoagii]|nr:hypothetical protein [Prescottella equi]NKU75102.1 hypothetical protein [Prescottella equi]